MIKIYGRILQLTCHYQPRDLRSVGLQSTGDCGANPHGCQVVMPVDSSLRCELHQSPL